MTATAHALAPQLAPVLAHPALARLGAQVQVGWPQPAPVPTDAWSLAELRGRLAELSPGAQPAVLTMAVAMIGEAQRQGQPAAWVAVGDDLFHAPDVAAGGVDLSALPVVRTGDPAAAGRAADLLLRSGAFGLVVIDLGAVRQPRLAMALQSRLVQLALKHDAAVLCLTSTPADDPSLGSLVSLRATASRRRLGPGRYACEVRAIKDKRQGPGWCWQGVWHGPDGLV